MPVIYVMGALLSAVVSPCGWIEPADRHRQALVQDLTLA